MAGKKILMLVGDFTEEYEIFVFDQAMEAVGHEVDIVCPDKKAGDILQTSLHDFEGHQTYTEKLGHIHHVTKTFSKVDPADYDAVYIAGGRGPEYIRIDKRVQKMLRHFHEHDKPIFTICHGVQVLMAVPETIRGKRGGGAPILRAGGDGRRRHLCRRAADRRPCRRQAGLGQGLDRARGVHAGMPEGARHRDPPRRDQGNEDVGAPQGSEERQRRAGRRFGLTLRSSVAAGAISPRPSPRPDLKHSRPLHEECANSRILAEADRVGISITRLFIAAQAGEKIGSKGPVGLVALT